MTLFGFTVVKTDTYKELLRDHFIKQRVVECHRWFAGWKDLDIIWDYLLQHPWQISEARRHYANARHTDEYGKSKTPPNSNGQKQAVCTCSVAEGSRAD